MKTARFMMGMALAMLMVTPIFAGEGHGKAMHDDNMMADSMSDDAMMGAPMMDGDMMEKPVNVGNKICPVSGEEIGGDMGEGVEVEYKGKIYNLCCAMCKKDFLKDPEKYIKKVETEMTGEMPMDAGMNHDE